jgi:hypothetical protein
MLACPVRLSLNAGGVQRHAAAKSNRANVKLRNVIPSVPAPSLLTF